MPSCVKFLGISIDRSLKFDSHIANVCNKISSSCYALRVIANNLNFSIARCTYFAIVESYLRYGICFWGSCSNYLFNSVFVLQKRAIRCLCGAKPNDSCRPLFVKHKILTLCCLYILEVACLVFKKFNCELTLTNNSNTRQTCLLKLPIPHSELIRGSFIYGGKKIFNKLPLVIRQCNTEKKLRIEIKKFLTGKAYYSLSEYFDDVT